MNLRKRLKDHIKAKERKAAIILVVGHHTIAFGMSSHQEFFAKLDQMCASSQLRIDRPRASQHPRIPQAIYPVDYGYLEGTTGGDGDGVDVFKGSEEGVGIVGVILTADLEKKDVEVKILWDCTNEEVKQIQELLGQVLSIGGLLVRRQLDVAPE